MKSPYEIAWDLLNKNINLKYSEIAKISGTTLEDVYLLRKRKSIDYFLNYELDMAEGNLNLHSNIKLLKKTIEDIEKNKPLWDIKGIEMKVSELINELQKIKNQDARVIMEAGNISDYAEVGKVTTQEDDRVVFLEED